MISFRGFSASQLFFGSNSVDLTGWDDHDEDLLLAQDTSAPGQFAPHGELRMMAQEAVSQKVANSKPRRLLANNETLHCTEVKIGDSVPTIEAPTRASWTLKKSGWPLDIDVKPSRWPDIACENERVRRIWVTRRGIRALGLVATGIVRQH